MAKAQRCSCDWENIDRSNKVCNFRSSRTPSLPPFANNRRYCKIIYDVTDDVLLTVRLDKGSLMRGSIYFLLNLETTFLTSSRQLSPLPVLEVPSAQPRLKISVGCNEEKSPGGDLATMDEIAREERSGGGFESDGPSFTTPTRDRVHLNKRSTPSPPLFSGREARTGRAREECELFMVKRSISGSASGEMSDDGIG